MGNTTNCSWWVWNKNNKMERKKEKKKRGKMDGDVVEGISNLFKATTRKKKKKAKLWICCHCEHKVM